MAEFENERRAVRRAREQLEEWVYGARSRAYEEFFEGPEARLTTEEIALLDRIDSQLARENRGGLWGTDEYGVLASGSVSDRDAPFVVCVYHPEIPEDYVHRGAGGIDDATEERLNDALWDYCERVASYIQEELEAYLDGEGEE